MARKTNNRGSSQPPKGRSKATPNAKGGSRGRALAKNLSKKQRQQLEAQRRRRRQFVMTGAVVG